jgi:hypothetical protein
MKKKKVKLNICFEFQCLVEANEDKEAFDKASDQAMDFLENKLSDSRKFDKFWEYEVKVNKVEISNVE